MSNTIWEVSFSTGMSLGPPDVNYWIKTSTPESAIVRAKRLLVRDQRGNGYPRSETRRYRLTAVKVAGTLDG